MSELSLLEDDLPVEDVMDSAFRPADSCPGLVVDVVTWLERAVDGELVDISGEDISAGVSTGRSRGVWVN